jgi:hypothetical protein
MRAAAAVILLLAVACARAGDPPAPAGDSIAAAKKDFAAIRGSAMAPDPASALPTLDIKDMGPSPGAPAAPTPLPVDRDPSLDPAKRASGTGNWLVDAMDKDRNSDRTHPSRPGDERLKPDLDLETDPEKTDAAGAKDSASRDDAREGASQKEPAEHAYNPLDSFMASWVSARDHDLLVPASKGDAPGATEPAPHSDVPGGPDLVPSGSLVDMLLPAPDAASWTDSKPDANPFVAPSDSEPAPAVRFFSGADSGGPAPFGLSEPVPGAGSPGPATQAGDSRTFLPDFAQPSDDDKYFKQMKRF